MLRTDCDFAQLTKNVRRLRAVRYFRCEVLPTTHLGFISKVRQGDPDPDHISTSFVERQNLTVRMAMRRFTRLTNSFSKNESHLKAGVALHLAHYNFCRVHSRSARHASDAIWHRWPRLEHPTTPKRSVEN